MSAAYSNTVFVGIPVLSQAFGSASLQYAFPVIAFHGLVAFSLYYLAAPHEDGAGKIGKSLRNAVSNPIVASLLLGLALNLAGVAARLPLTALLALLSGAALPCALLALGASLAGFRIQGLGETLVVTAAKLLLLLRPVCWRWRCSCSACQRQQRPCWSSSPPARSVSTRRRWCRRTARIRPRSARRSCSLAWFASSASRSGSRSCGPCEPYYHRLQ
ncbi:hypothetical protein LP420_18825 [Massilia sp. B-10]|nr:hypothetical protein LP420_18825 [Massilia sp. B-10]